jgi:hypothetical protein
MKTIPPIFCWSKMGSESGEKLAEIILRKEWERQLGGGYFFWGIGQSLGEKVKTLAPSKTPLKVIFSPMPSKPKPIDEAPEQVVLWNAWIDAKGDARPLPEHCFITSRASLPSGREKESHYALICFSDQELISQNSDINIVPKYLCNAGSNKPLGASQVTALVQSISQKTDVSNSKSYSVSFTAELQLPYYIQLTHPSKLDTDELLEIREITNSRDLGTWITFVRSLRSRVNSIDFVQPYLDFGIAETSSVPVGLCHTL